MLTVSRRKLQSPMRLVRREQHFHFGQFGPATAQAGVGEKMPRGCPSVTRLAVSATEQAGQCLVLERLPHPRPLPGWSHRTVFQADLGATVHQAYRPHLFLGGPPCPALGERNGDLDLPPGKTGVSRPRAHPGPVSEQLAHSVLRSRQRPWVFPRLPFSGPLPSMVPTCLLPCAFNSPGQGAPALSVVWGWTEPRHGLTVVLCCFHSAQHAVCWSRASLGTVFPLEPPGQRRGPGLHSGG